MMRKGDRILKYGSWVSMLNFRKHKELKIAILAIIITSAFIVMCIKYPWTMIILPVAYATFYLILLIYGEYSGNTRIFKLICNKVKSREVLDEEMLITMLSQEAGVPHEFAKEYLASIAFSFNAEIGHLRLDDRFDNELAINISELPWRLSKNLKNEQGYTDARNFSDFICWEWYSDRCKFLHENTFHELEQIALNPHITILELCKKLYMLEKV